MKPPVATELCFGCPVEGIETYPKTARVGPLYQCAQPGHLRWCPLSSVWLSAGLNHLPRVVPPAPVVRRFHRIHYLGCSGGLLPFGMNGAEEQHTITGLQLIVEHALL